MENNLTTKRGPCSRPGGRKRGAFTAIETLMAAAVLAIISAAVSGALSAGRQQSKTAQDMLHASMLARALLDEIARLPYADPNGYATMGPDPGETSRALYDNVDDYSGYTDGPTGLCDISGNVYPADMQGYTRTVTMAAAGQTPAGWGQTINGLVATVTVARNGSTIATLQRYMTP